MKIKLDVLNLTEILKQFYTLTGIRAVIFNTDYEEIFSYPDKACNFCQTVRQNHNFADGCYRSDLEGFEQCTNMTEVYIYKCHMGLVEAVLPIKNGNHLLGYMMLGEITDFKDPNRLKILEAEMLEKHDISCDTSSIKYKTKKQIVAASKLLKICTDYMLIKEMIGSENKKVISSVQKYIDEHLGDDISIYDICNHVGINRTKLYEMFKNECGTGIAAYIKNRRLEHAKHLIRDTDFTISEISALVRFPDYNYFSRVYKEKYNISPHKDR